MTVILVDDVSLEVETTFLIWYVTGRNVKMYARPSMTDDHDRRLSCLFLILCVRIEKKSGLTGKKDNGESKSTNIQKWN
jgi:hypothetical protein